MIGFTLRGHLQTTRHSQVTSGAFPTGSRNPTYRTPQRTSGVRVRAPLGSTADEREGQAGDTRAIEEGKRRTEHGTAHTHHSPEHGTAHTHHSPEHGTAHTHTTRRNTDGTHTPLAGTRHGTHTHHSSEHGTPHACTRQQLPTTTRVPRPLRSPGRAPLEPPSPGRGAENITTPGPRQSLNSHRSTLFAPTNARPAVSHPSVRICKIGIRPALCARPRS